MGIEKYQDPNELKLGFKFKHLGENLVLISRWRPLAVLDLDTKEITRISAQN